ncbi:uncharacterized protein LOC144915045 isoform X2 [Branchiostoma floridae x Branchiostoma belcheri]
MRDMFQEELGKLEMFQCALRDEIAALKRENEALERSVSFLSDKNNNLTRKLDFAKKAYSKVLATLQKLQEDTDHSSTAEDTEDSSSVESLELTKDNSTVTEELANLTLEKAAQEKEILEATVQQLTLENKKQAKMLEDREQLQDDLETSNKAIQLYHCASEKLLAENDRITSKLEKSQKASNNKITALQQANEALKRSLSVLMDRDNIINSGIADFKGVLEHMKNGVFRKREDPATPSRHSMGDGRKLVFELQLKEEQPVSV